MTPSNSYGPRTKCSPITRTDAARASAAPPGVVKATRTAMQSPRTAPVTYR